MVHHVPIEKLKMVIFWLEHEVCYMYRLYKKNFQIPFVGQGEQYCAILGNEKSVHHQNPSVTIQFSSKMVRIQSTHMKKSSKLILPNVSTVRPIQMNAFMSNFF